MVAANSLLLFLLTTGLTPDPDQPTTPIPWRSISETDEPPVNEDNEFDSKDLLPCPKHERFDRCLAHCQRNCTNYKEKYIPCPLICEPGCICVEGYVRGPEGKCIPKEKCSRSSERCREHSKFDHCGAHPSCQKNCQNYNEHFPCPAICVPGCICEDGYVEGPNKECIKKEECRHYSEERCPKHSKFDHCGAHPLCQKNCQNYNENFPCPSICMPGCICEDGYVEGPNKECIKKEECRHYSEGWDSIFETEEPPVNEDNEFESDALRCPEHEHWVLCEAHCQKNCTNYKQNLPCDKRCVGGCVCDRGYVRGLNGKCILEEKCPMETAKCPEHEHWDRCLAHCQKNCTNYDKPFPCTMECFPGCVCDEGHVRGPNGKCILKGKCPKEPAHECPEHEHWVLCEAHCQKNCTNYKQNLPCTKNCVAGCVCDRGYVRGLNGKCIRRDKCPKVSGWDSISETEEPPTGEDHHFELRERCRNHYKFDQCGAHPLCQKNCQNYNENFPCPSICMPGCICEDGYVEGPNKECIKKEECRHYSEDKKCPKNSQYVECGAYPLCQKTCENYDKLIPCPAVCVPGCVCEEGFVKGPDGECIPIHECPHKSEAHGCPEHEHWNLCEAHCQKNCTNYKQTLPCNKRCVAGCVCDRGYVRGLNGKCILKEKCPMETERTDTKRACPPREHISRCMGHCQKTCESYLKPKPCPRKCQKGCVCDGGLVRGPRGRCIMPSKCPAILDMEETVQNSFCPDNPNGCLEYCIKRGAKHGQCQGYQRAECICINRS